MTIDRHPSDSKEQKLAEKLILLSLNKKYKFELKSNILPINSTRLQVDGYSESPPILCEIYAHIGKLKPAQKDKISKDILKMLLIDKVNNKTYKKIIVFADDEAAKSYSNVKSWYSEIQNYFSIEIIIVEISDELRQSLLEAQKKQYR